MSLKLDLNRLKRYIVNRQVDKVLEIYENFFQYSSVEQHLLRLMAEYLLALFAQLLRRSDWIRLADFHEFLTDIEVYHFPAITDDTPMFSIISSEFDYYPGQIDSGTGSSIRSSYNQSIEYRVSGANLPPNVAMVVDCFLLTRAIQIMRWTSSSDPRIGFIFLSIAKGHRDSYDWDYHRQKLANLPLDSLATVITRCCAKTECYYRGLQLLGRPINLSVYSTCQDPLLLNSLIREYQRIRWYDDGNYQLNHRPLMAKSYQILENRLAGIKTPIELTKGDWQAMIQTVEDWRCYTERLRNRGNACHYSWCYYDFVLGSQFVPIEELLSQLNHTGWVKDGILCRDPQVANWIVAERSFLKRYLTLPTKKSEDVIYQLILSFCRLKNNWDHLSYFFPEFIDEPSPETHELS